MNVIASRTLPPTVRVLRGAPAAQALAPLIALLEESMPEGSGLAPGLAIGSASPGSGPVLDARELAGAPPARLGELVAEYARQWAAPSHVGAALWWKSFAYWTSLPVALGWALGRRVPLMTAGLTALRPQPEPPGMLVGLRELCLLSDDAGDDEALGAAIGATLVREVFAPVIDALQGLTRAGRRGLWGTAAECLAHPILTIGRDLVDDPPAEAMALLRGVGGPMADLIEPPGPGDTAVRRRTCCLWVTLPDREACPSCCVLQRPGAA